MLRRYKDILDDLGKNRDKRIKKLRSPETLHLKYCCPLKRTVLVTIKGSWMYP